MIDPEFLRREDVLEIQDLALREGGLPGILDEGSLSMALLRPINTLHYSPDDLDLDLYDLAAEYAFAFATLHAFNDANKRTGYMSCMVFLHLHGIDLRDIPYKMVEMETADGSETVSEGEKMMVDLVTGAISVGDFAQWLRSFPVP